MVDRQALGRWGEEHAVRHLEAAGYEVLSRNWRCREGELDIVARSGGALVFVEVKARTGTAYGEPAEAVTR
ncbi:MAG: YraN family protein, partial [Mycobacteriales bacterium]